MNKLLHLVFLLIALISYKCKSPLEGDNPIKNIKDPRTLTWTIDTVKYPSAYQTLMISVWGSSPADVFACGHNSITGELLLHFNGFKWEEIDLKNKLSLMSFDLRQVFGFSQNDVWVIGFQDLLDPVNKLDLVHAPLVIHFDGTNWKEHRLDFYDRNPNHYSAPMYSIYGDRPDNVWVSGVDGWVAHFDGNKWAQDTLKLDNPQDLNLVSISVYNNQTYIIAQDNPSAAMSHYYSMKGSIKNWSVVDSFWANETEKFGYVSLYSNFNKLYSCSSNVFQLDGSSWSTFIPITGRYSSVHMTGTSPDNLIIAGYNGLFHWNGSNLFQIKLPGFKDYDYVVWDVWYDGQEAFVVGYSYQNQSLSFIWHGK